MRFAILLFALFSVSAFAQDPIPDTTDWHSYFPLEVGNEWQYRAQFHPPVYPGWTFSNYIVADSIVGDTTHFLMRRCTQLEGESVSCRDPDELVRYDEELATVVVRIEQSDGTTEYTPWPDVPCRLNSPFGQLEEDDCFEFFGPGRYAVVEYGSTAIIGGSAAMGTLKYFDGLAGSFSFLSGIGFIGEAPEGGSFNASIQYARIADVEYGNPIVSKEADVPRSESEIRTYPNPARDEATLQFSVPEPQNLVASVFNLRGALVETKSLGSAADGVEVSYTFDASLWPSGLYTIRLIGDRGFFATKGIIVIH